MSTMLEEMFHWFGQCFRNTGNGPVLHYNRVFLSKMFVEFVIKRFLLYCHGMKTRVGCVAEIFCSPAVLYSVPSAPNYKVALRLCYYFYNCVIDSVSDIRMLLFSSFTYQFIQYQNSGLAVLFLLMTTFSFILIDSAMWHNIEH